MSPLCPRTSRRWQPFSGRHGYTTAAFVSSRVLDRRFGLDRGFALYDDAMVAERTGRQGTPSGPPRPSRTRRWLGPLPLPRDRPYFLWVHYYDPHAPYVPPGDCKHASRDERYAGEVANMDREIGRLLASLPATAGGPVSSRRSETTGRCSASTAKRNTASSSTGRPSACLWCCRVRVSPRRPPPSARGSATRALPGTLLGLLGLSAEAPRFGPPPPGIARGRAVPTPLPPDLLGVPAARHRLRLEPARGGDRCATPG